MVPALGPSPFRRGRPRHCGRPRRRGRLRLRGGRRGGGNAKLSRRGAGDVGRRGRGRPHLARRSDVANLELETLGGRRNGVRTTLRRAPAIQDFKQPAQMSPTWSWRPWLAVETGCVLHCVGHPPSKSPRLQAVCSSQNHLPSSPVQEGILTLKSCDSMISYTPGNSTTWIKQVYWYNRVYAGMYQYDFILVCTTIHLFVPNRKFLYSYILVYKVPQHQQFLTTGHCFQIDI
jgi:hypothetical protein